MYKVLVFDDKVCIVMVDVGIIYVQFCLYLDSKGFVFYNLVLFLDIIVVGVISIVMYGLGNKNGNFVIVVYVFEFVYVNGDVVKYLCGLFYLDELNFIQVVVVGLGVFGVIIWIILDI